MDELSTKFKDTDFLHASSRLKVIEKKLLTRRQLLQMIDAQTIEEAYKIANDAGIGANIPVEEYERALQENLRETYRFLDTLSGETGVLDLFRYEYDALNLKILIKAHAMGRDASGQLVDLGMVPAAVLCEELREMDFERLHPLLAEAAAEATDTLARTRDPQQVDLIVDRALMAATLRKAGEYDNAFLHKIVRCRIDLVNLRSLVRAKKMDRDIAFLRQILIPGGSLEAGEMETAFLGGSDAVVGYIEATPYGAWLEPALADIRGGGSLSAFERLCDNYLVHILHDTRWIPFGIELVIAHLLAKESEIKAVRTVLASRMAGVAPELIKERLRETYA